ncbi:DUF6282 family protein [Homoserinibacter sp. YIM 151385]|uniref:DUF6282 family protein n=1 Tax=Homoserinibacter sp. YIM 151385 TaxID=2985506 RepID=UPI0022F0A64A|nr:DUF6282 family protein [Homoserinibacter sp. YIM 151385]WBU37080.1 DUF6282 family protein [Homoserinibacter sp. YIM 151385]
MTVIDDLLDGAVDLHCHSGPSPMPRRITHVEAAQQAADAGFRAILVKCHYHDTVTDVLSMAPQLEGLPTAVYGGIALNSVNGGLNPWATDRSFRMGGRMVWFPTISSRIHLAHAEAHAETKAHFQPLGMLQSEEVAVVDGDGEVRPEVGAIIEQARDAGAIVSTGHLDSASALAVVRTAHGLGHDRIVVSHPDFVSDIGREQLAEMIELGAVVEHEIAMYHRDHIFPAEQLVDWIRALGPEHTILGSDLGQVGNPLPVEGYRGLLGRLLQLGVAEEDLALMVQRTPARLLGLES